MANIQARAYASLTQAQLQPATFERAYQLSILELIRRELHTMLSANDIDTLEQHLIDPLVNFYTNPANDQGHLHLAANQAVTVFQWPVLGNQSKRSYPMFNVYDLLAVAHTIFTKRYGFLPISAGTRANKPIDKPIPFAQIPKAGKEDFSPINIVQILESLRNCCNAFSYPRNGGKPRTQSMPAMAGYSMPTRSSAARPMFPSFGVVTAGTPQQKAEIITARLARFSQAVRDIAANPGGAAQAAAVANWVCGNCAEQAYWPIPGDELTDYEGITIIIRNFGGVDKIAPGRSAQNCENCKLLSQQLVREGFIMKDIAAFGRP
ncbi:uncharacterized protein KY384_001642 [Bacidia gigantensis]|uniref:uncharacterized protein n=1 Tax=Bacidia gigantensis TaxID=2732470 RepID=UPI001D04C93C|nr:uncharacterized protein KY384_001642 [Bacidia gigantensis]KAG8533901.1 hypothetical protein KY384_001642 [Bacidia gigantensis]